MPHPLAADRVSAAASAKNVFRMAIRILSAFELRRRRGGLEFHSRTPLGPLPACALWGVAKQGEIDFENWVEPPAEYSAPLAPSRLA